MVSGSKRSSVRQAIIAYSLLFFGFAGAATPVIQADFQGANPGAYIITFGAPAPPSASVDYTAGEGINGTTALVINGDFSRLSPQGFVFAGFGAALDMFPDPAPLNAQAITDFAISLDFRAKGLNTPNTALILKLRFYNWNLGPLGSAYVDQVPATSDFQHFSAKLSTFTFDTVPWNEFLANRSKVEWINLSIIAGGGPAGGPPDFGYDADNAIVVDNIRMESVPEPTTPFLLLFGIGAAILRQQTRIWTGDEPCYGPSPSPGTLEK